MASYLTIAYKEDSPEILLDQNSKRSEHHSLFKAIVAKNEKGYSKVEIWSLRRGRVRLRKLSPSMEAAQKADQRSASISSTGASVDQPNVKKKSSTKK